MAGEALKPPSNYINPTSILLTIGGLALVGGGAAFALNAVNHSGDQPETIGSNNEGINGMGGVDSTDEFIPTAIHTPEPTLSSTAHTVVEAAKYTPTPRPTNTIAPTFTPTATKEIIPTFTATHTPEPTVITDPFFGEMETVMRNAELSPVEVSHDNGIIEFQTLKDITRASESFDNKAGVLLAKVTNPETNQEKLYVLDKTDTTASGLAAFKLADTVYNNMFEGEHDANVEFYLATKMNDQINYIRKSGTNYDVDHNLFDKSKTLEFNGEDISIKNGSSVLNIYSIEAPLEQIVPITGDVVGQYRLDKDANNSNVPAIIEFSKTYSK